MSWYYFITSIMSDHPQHPKRGIPEECVALMKQLHQSTAMGNFKKCMDLQQRTNNCFRENRLPAYEFPIEYFELMHQLFDPATMNDQEKMKELSDKLMAFQTEAGVDFSPEGELSKAIEFPEEYHLLQKKAAEAFERKDWPEFKRIVGEAEATLNKMGIFNIVNIISDPAEEFVELEHPQEWSQLKQQAEEAYERGDLIEFNRIKEALHKKMGIVSFINDCTDPPEEPQEK